MAQLIISAAGAAIGFSVGGMTGAQIGWAIGGMLGSSMAGPTKVQGSQQALMDLRVTGSEYGQPIPYVRGGVGIAGQMWWNTDRRPTTTTTTESSGGKGGGGSEVSSSTISYDMDVLIGLTDNEIVGISRIWDNGKLIYTADSGATAGSLEASAEAPKWTRLTVYTGSMTQLPDPTYEAAVGITNAPAYRGRSYVFIEGLKLGQSGQVPNLTFEVIADGAETFLTETTFNSSDKSERITLSNGDLTATADGTNNYMVARSTARSFKSSGKWYMEFTISNAGTAASETEVGIATSLAALNTFVGLDAYGFGYTKLNGYKRGNGITAVYGSAWASGDIVSMLLDMDAGSIVFWLNGVSQGTAFSANLAGKTFCPAVCFYSPGAITANYGATAFAYTIPEGYSGWHADAVYTYGTVPPAVSSVVSALCLRAGLTAGQIDVTGLSTITRTAQSLAVSQIAPTREALELLMSTYFFEMVVSDKIYFRPRGGASVASIAYLDLGASAGDDQPEPLALRQMNELEIPAQIALTYVNIDDDYQTDTQYSDRLISATAGTVSTVSMAIGMTPAEAKAVADTMLLDQAASVISTTIALLGDYCRLEPTDPVTVTGPDGSSFRLRLVKKTDSYPLLSFDAVLDDVSVLTSQGITSADYTSSTVVLPAVNTEMELMDIPILQDTDNDAGFYVAAKGDGTPYAGSAIFNSADDVEYVRKATVLESAVFGTCTTTLGNWTGARVFDEINTVTVNVGDGTLASSTRDAILNSLTVNAMLIGSELIQFKTATLVSAGVYTLSGLLRGGRGTEWAMTGHAASERCVLLRAAGLRRIAMLNNELGLSRYYKGVTLGRALSTATAESFTDNAVGLKPFSPFDLRATRDGSNNITFTWQRRSRLAVRMIGALGISLPLGEDVEAYQVDIFASGAYSAVLRTISATTATASYTAAQQTTDGLTPGNAVYARVYQMSSTIGRGYKLEQAA